MTKKTAISALVAAALTVASVGALAWSGPAFAEQPECPGGPRDTWIGIDAATARAASLGYTVRKIEIDDGCYEIKGTDKNGAKVELNLDPVTGQPVPHAAHKK